MRKIGRERECQILLCGDCKRTITISDKLSTALQRGYARLQKPIPSDQDVDTMIWRGLTVKQSLHNITELDLWMPNLA